MPRYVPRAGKETLLHLSFWASAEKLRSSDPTPTITVALVDLHKNSEVLGTEVVRLTHDWQLHYVVVDLKTEHVGHSIRPFLYLGAQRGIYHFDEFECAIAPHPPPFPPPSSLPSARRRPRPCARPPGGPRRRRALWRVSVCVGGDRGDWLV